MEKYLLLETLRAMKAGLYGNNIEEYINEANLLSKRLGDVMNIPDGWQRYEKHISLVKWIAEGRYEHKGILKQALKSV